MEKSDFHHQYGNIDFLSFQVGDTKLNSFLPNVLKSVKKRKIATLILNFLRQKSEESFSIFLLKNTNLVVHFFVINKIEFKHLYFLK